MSKICLMILDGWGIGDRSKADAVFNAHTPFIDSIVSKYPSSTLVTHGKDVGLPEGQMGNSEVGHLNIGAGRVVHQELSRINLAITDGSFFKNEALISAFDYAETNGVKIHLLGLVSNGGVHSSMMGETEKNSIPRKNGDDYRNVSIDYYCGDVAAPIETSCCYSSCAVEDE